MAMNSGRKVLSEITTSRKRTQGKDKKKAEKPRPLKCNIKTKTNQGDNIGSLKWGHSECKKALLESNLCHKIKKNIIPVYKNN